MAAAATPDAGAAAGGAGAAPAPASAEAAGPMVVLVTGGTGLVGRAIRDAVEAHPREGETWHFVSSKDADLRYVIARTCDSKSAGG